jgi:hypothetical protein
MPWNASIRETVALDVIRGVLGIKQERPEAKELVEYAYDVADHFIALGESHTAKAAQANHLDQARKRDEETTPIGTRKK